MTTQIQHRWGILAIAVLMFFVTLVITQINGSKTSFYYLVWIMVGYYAYKARLFEIQIMMKYLIYLNAAVLALVIIFMDSDSLSYVAKGGKTELVFDVLIMAAPKILLFFYCKKQLEVLADDLHSSEREPASSSQQVRLNAVPSSVTPVDVRSMPAIHTNEANKLRESYYETAMEEVVEGKQRKGLWAMCLAHNSGNLEKTTASYINARVSETEGNIESEQDFRGGKENLDTKPSIFFKIFWRMCFFSSVLAVVAAIVGIYLSDFFMSQHVMAIKLKPTFIYFTIGFLSFLMIYSKRIGLFMWRGILIENIEIMKIMKIYTIGVLLAGLINGILAYTISTSAWINAKPILGLILFAAPLAAAIIIMRGRSRRGRP